MSWPQIKKKIILNYCLLLLYAITMSHFSIRLWCAIKSGFCMTTSDNWLNSWTKKKAPKHFPKPNLHWKKVGHWWSAACLIHYSLPNPGKATASRRGVGREMEGSFKRERIYVYLWLIHVEVWQKTTEFCKATILQLKNKWIKKIIVLLESPCLKLSSHDFISFLVVGRWGYPALSNTVATSHM